MPTTTPLTDAIQALTTYANETTGASDTTLSEAVGTLVAGYGQGGGGWTTDGIASGTEPNGDITITTPRVANGAFYVNSAITSVTTNGTTIIGDYAFQNCSNLVFADLSGVTSFSGSGQFKGCTKLTSILIPDLVTITNQCFYGATINGSIGSPGVLKLQSLQNGQANSAFYGGTFTKVYLFKKVSVSFQQNMFNGCSSCTDIYVPWSEGEVSGAPWGANNATVHYNTVYDENDEPIE